MDRQRILFFIFFIASFLALITSKNTLKLETKFIYLGWGIFIIISIIALGVIYVRMEKKRIENFYKNFAMRHGFQFGNDNVLKLRDELNDTNFVSDLKITLNSIKNCLIQDDLQDRLTLFNCFAETGGNRKMHFTISYFKLSKDLGLNMQIDQRDKNLWSGIDFLQIEQDSKDLVFEGNEEFNEKFLVAFDNEEICAKLMNKEVLDYFVSNKDLFLSIHAIEPVYLNRDKLIISFQHGLYETCFKNDAELERFINFSKELKEKLLKASS